MIMTFVLFGRLPFYYFDSIARLKKPFFCERKRNASKTSNTYDHLSTQTEDVSATLKNGVLTLRIDCGKPFEQDDEQEVPVSIE